MNCLFCRYPGELDHITYGGINRERATSQTTGSGTHNTTVHFHFLTAERIAPVWHSCSLHGIGDQHQPVFGATAAELHGRWVDMVSVSDKFQPGAEGRLTLRQPFLDPDDVSRSYVIAVHQSVSTGVKGRAGLFPGSSAVSQHHPYVALLQMFDGL